MHYTGFDSGRKLDDGRESAQAGHFAVHVAFALLDGTHLQRYCKCIHVWCAHVQALLLMAFARAA
jgi:hypothetical protein